MRTNICQVCGKEYDVCKTPYIAEGYFRWNDVACSPKCGAEYLARKMKGMQADAAMESEAVVEETPVLPTKKTNKKTKKSTSTTKDNEKG